MNDKLITAEQSMSVFGSKDNFESAQRMAKCLAASAIVPKEYQGQEGLANCIIALEMANRIGASPIMVMQNLYIVHGKPGWSSKFLIACLNSSSKFKTPIRYEFKGKENTDEWGCRAYATDSSDEVLYGSWVTIAMAKQENWFGKDGSKWKTMPEQMLRYRAAAFFQRAYAPEISMGMLTSDEIEDVDYIDVTDAVKHEVEQNANKANIGFESASNTTTPPQENKAENSPKQHKPEVFQADVPDIFK